MFSLAARVTALKLARCAVGWLRNESDATALMRRLPHSVGVPPEDDIKAHLMRGDIVHRLLCSAAMGPPASRSDMSRLGAAFHRQEALCEDRVENRSHSVIVEVEVTTWL